MKVMITKERSELTDLVSAAIKSTYSTRSRCGVERCMDVLKQLKSLTLFGKEIRLSDSIFKLESLQRHRHPEIRKEAQSLFDSWSKTLYAHGRENSFEATLTNIRLKPKKHVLTRCSELKKDDQRLLTRDPEEIKKKKSFMELTKNEDERSLTLETKKIKKETKAGFLELKKKEAMKNKREEELEKKKTELMELFEDAKKAADVANAKGLLSGKPEVARCVDALSLLMSINITPQPKEPKRMVERLEALTRHKDRKICHAASALLNLWQQRIREPSLSMR